MLREVIIKIGLERINTQKGVTVEILLNSRVISLVISSEFAKKQKFKLKKIERLIYMRNINRTFNKERLIKYNVKVNIYYQEYRERTKIDVIKRQKQNIILKILWLAYYNSEIDWRIEEVKITRCSKECRKQ